MMVLPENPLPPDPFTGNMVIGIKVVDETDSMASLRKRWNSNNSW